MTTRKGDKVSELSLNELMDEGSNEYFDMGADDDALHPTLADPGEAELTCKSYVIRTDKSGVGRVSAALEIEGGDYETVWFPMGLPHESITSVGNRIRTNEILSFGEAYKLPNGTIREVLTAIDEGEGKGNTSWAVLGTESYTDPDTGVTTTRNVVEKFIIK